MDKAINEMTLDELHAEIDRTGAQASTLRDQREALNLRILEQKEAARGLSAQIAAIEAPIIAMRSEITRRRKRNILTGPDVG